MLLDFAIISSLIVAAHLLRARVVWLGKALIPTSIIAGALGLAAGPYGLDWLPFSQVEVAGRSSLAISRVPAVLIVFVFATLLMGHRRAEGSVSSRLKQVRGTLFYNLAAEFGQFGLAILLGGAVLSLLYPELPEEFIVMLPAGFAGGAGTSTVFAQGFEKLGWNEALTVGFAFAAMGQMAAVTGGMILINLAVRRGWTQFSDRRLADPAELASGFIPEGRQSSAGTVTVNPTALDPLAWHVALAGMVYGAAIGLDALIHLIIPGSYLIPTFAVAMLVGGAVQAGLNQANVGQFVDLMTMRRIGSACADVLIVCSIASIKLDVVSGYAGPIVLLAVFGCLYAVAVFFVGAAVFKDHWFEPSIFTYGWNTGVVGTSVALVRVVDPQMKTRAVQDYGTAFLGIGPVEMILYPLIIWACGAGRVVPLAAALTLLAVALFLAAGWASHGANSTSSPRRIAESTLEPTIVS